MDWLLIGATPWYFSLDAWINIAKGVMGLGFVIFVHELGHFLAAKACGVKCEKFYVGFDPPISIGGFKLPRALFKFRYGETEYGIGILPLGGYVKMLGQDDDPRNTLSENERIRLENGEAAGDAAAGPSSAASGGAGDGEYKLDPRSFPAKNVPQRMLIISAGVIMNLIFAVIFAGVAYQQGVQYMTCEIGSVVAGSPAWSAGIAPGDRIVQIGRDGRHSGHLRFDWDLLQGVGMAGADQDLDLLVRRSSGEEQWLSLRPRVIKFDGEERPTIGIRQVAALKLNPVKAALPHLPAGAAGFLPGDEIQAVDGEPVASYYELQQALWKRADQAVKFTVRRTEGDSLKTVEVEVQPNRRRTLGLVMKHGAISGVRPGSPAEKAGLRPGDQLDAIAGQPIGNPVTLPHRLREWFGKEVEVTVKRPQGKDEFETVTVKLTVDVPASTASTEEPADLNIVGVESLGIAYPVFDTVAAVEPDSPAAAAGMQPGDKLQTVQFVVDDSAVAKAKELFGEDLNTPMVLDPSRDHWLEVEASLQRIVRESKVRVTFQRGDKTEKADITPVDDAQVCIPQRGLLFTAKTELLVVDSWGEAISLGFRQTREDARRIGGLVYRLITGKVSYKNLGGPLSIGVMAASEASKGLPSLLLFLTFLSANLAVLNFLPIPALDGGHMVFLLWEGIFRKPVNERVQMALTMAGVLCLLGLMVVVFGLDFWRFTR